MAFRPFLIDFYLPSGNLVIMFITDQLKCVADGHWSKDIFDKVTCFLGGFIMFRKRFDWYNGKCFGGIIPWAKPKLEFGKGGNFGQYFSKSDFDRSFKLKEVLNFLALSEIFSCKTLAASEMVSDILCGWYAVWKYFSKAMISRQCVPFIFLAGSPICKAEKAFNIHSLHWAKGMWMACW